MAAKCHNWLFNRMNREEYLAWLAIAPDQSIVAGAGLWVEVRGSSLIISNKPGLQQFLAS
jgi:hypothetical protein